MNTSDVFISYRRRDVTFVKQLTDALIASGRDVWVDWQDIPPGAKDFSREIQIGIESANTFIAVLTPDFLGSEYCLQELAYAADLKKRIIPIVHRKVDDLTVPASIQMINWIYFLPHAGQTNAFSESLNALNHAIDTDYNYLREHTRLLTRAQDWLKHDKNWSFLLSGEELVTAESWLAKAAQYNPPAAPIHTEFILRSRQAQSQRQRRLLSGALVLLTLAIFGLIVAIISGVEARRQQLIAERRSDETLSLAAADAAEEYVELGEYLSGIQLAYYANTFLDDTPDLAQETLRQIAFLPGTRYAFFDDLPSNHSNLDGLQTGTSVKSSDQSHTTLVAISDNALHILSDDGQILMRLNKVNRPRGWTTAQEYDTSIHPNVINQYNVAGVYDVPIAVSPDGQIAAIGGEGGLKIINNDSDASLQLTLSGHTNVIDTLHFSEDGRFLVSRASTDLLANSSLADKEFFVWDTTTWRTITQLNNFGGIRDLYAISANGLHLLFIESSPPGYTLWDIRDNRLLFWDEPSSSLIQDLGFAQDGKSLVVASIPTLRMRPPRLMRILDLNGSVLAQFGGFDSNHIIDLPILLSPGGTALRVVTNEGTLSEVNLETTETDEISTIPAHPIYGASSNGQFIVLRDFNEDDLVIWSLENEEPIIRIQDDNIGLQMTLSNDSRWLAHTTDSQNLPAALIVRDLSDGRVVASFDDFHVGSGLIGTRTFAFSSDGQKLVYADTQGTLQVIATDIWTVKQELRGAPGNISDLDFSQDNSLITAAVEQGIAIVWDMDTGNILQRIDGHNGVTKVSISPDGLLLLIGDEQGQLSLWQINAVTDILTWLEQNRAILPVTCEDLIQARVIETINSCPIN